MPTITTRQGMALAFEAADDGFLREPAGLNFAIADESHDGVKILKTGAIHGCIVRGTCTILRAPPTLREWFRVRARRGARTRCSTMDL